MPPSPLLTLSLLLVSGAAAADGEVIHVEGETTEAQLMQRSAEAVNVVDTAKAATQTADLGEVLARTQGVAVRRTAGLGSTARFSLDGLSDDQIRFFLDGVPLDIAGYPFGIANVPVNLVERVEVYRGVVPVRFGADALGGAVNLVSANPRGTHAAMSYQLGSFGTFRGTESAKYADDDSGLFAAFDAFYDRAKNDYPVDVEIPNAQGQLVPATVRRFHDGYRAAGTTLGVGVTGRDWADRLELRGYYTGYHKDLQSNAVMTVPYGEVAYGERVGGASAHYQVSLPAAFRLDALAAYAHRTISFSDQSPWVYDWRGARVLERQTPGELDGHPHDDRYTEHGAYARLLAARAVPMGEVRLAVTPSYTTRTGESRARTDTAARDPLSAKHDRLTVVSGAEWELDTSHDEVQNIAFAKSYAFRAGYENVVPGNIFQDKSRTRATFGAGDSARWKATPWLYLKASYEYATRLPTSDELFGDGVLIGANTELAPEVSHNVNLGPRIEYKDLIVDLSGFWRESQNLIVLLGNAQYLTYQNVYDARSLGAEASAAWRWRWLALDGSITYVDQRNSSSAGTFGNFEGDRIPNRPWLFASGGARASYKRIEPFYVARYVHGFLRGWESIGQSEYKESIPAQLAHDIGLTYSYWKLSATFEIDNLLNAHLYDSFGAQRPGRAYSLKLTFER